MAAAKSLPNLSYIGPHLIAVCSENINNNVPEVYMSFSPWSIYVNRQIKNAVTSVS